MTVDFNEILTRFENIFFDQIQINFVIRLWYKCRVEFFFPAISFDFSAISQ